MVIFKITPTINKLSFKSTMHDTKINAVSWHVSSHKPIGNTLTDALPIAISRHLKVIHEPQCKNQTKEPRKISLSVVVIVSKVHQNIIDTNSNDSTNHPPENKSHGLHPIAAPPRKAPRGTDHLYPSPRLMLAATPPPSIAPKRLLVGLH